MKTLVRNFNPLIAAVAVMSLVTLVAISLC